MKWWQCTIDQLDDGKAALRLLRLTMKQAQIYQTRLDSLRLLLNPRNLTLLLVIASHRVDVLIVIW